ncbi:hypothetical protein ILUMI_05155 [Ignelater luminosus]|uniref:NADH dehydrogenase [ubiquinone] 1 beta subcomplex subunit 4 n=1 Tax=Ignelater luminosus TaxID=2038154 RepID=A0A8K0DI79_IGNLU|nr:hypothetical protein ILUMI_05155 [Ignelater luminosus]
MVDCSDCGLLCDIENRKKLEARARRRAVLREEFLKLSTDPRRHAAGEGGAVFDAGIQRFTAMKINTYEHFKPTFRNVRIGLLAMVVPMAIYGYFMKYERDCKEHQYRTGQVAYKDRLFKFC